MSASASIRAGVSSAFVRLRGRATVGVLASALVAVLVIALIERRESVAGASDRALAAVFRFVLPLAALSLSQIPIGAKNLKEAIWPAARFGLHRGWVAAGFVLAGAVVAAASAALLGVVAVAAARAGAPARAGEMSLAADLLTTGWIAPLVAVAYAAWFGLGATFGRAGGGRGVVLLADFIVGSVGFFGVLLPKGSAYNLIGLAAPMDVPQRAASAVLAGVTLACMGLLIARCRR